MAEVNPAEISAILKKQLKDFDSSSSLNEIGSVLAQQTLKLALKFH